MRAQISALVASMLVLAGAAGAQQIVECPALPPVAGVCSVTAGDANLLIEGTILQEDRVLRRGQLLVGSDGVIACAACDCSTTPGYATATRVSCPQGVVSPGFIDLHEHSSFSTAPPVNHGTERFDHRHDWRLGLRGHTAISAVSDTTSGAVTYGEVRHLLSGTTSISGGNSVPGFVRNLDRPADLEGLTEPALDTSTFPLADTGGPILSSGCAYPGFDAPVPGSVYVPHVAQGIDGYARNELSCLLDASLAGGHDALYGAALVDSIALTADDAARLRSRGASVIWSPRHDVSLYGMTTQVTMLAQEGVNVALATSWLVTGSMNLHRELQCAMQLNDTYFDGRFSARDLLGMVTWKAARAAGMDQAIGRLTPGHWADLVIFDGSTRSDYDAAVQGHPADVALVLRGGLPMYGDAGVLEDLGAGDGVCEVSVNPLGSDCLSDKRVCVTRESGGALSWASVTTYSYGLPYRCGSPSDEPTCVPLRDEGDGILFDGTVTAGDLDGDGVANGADNCPTTFNPPRPMDGFTQSDDDGDGAGDACDDRPANLLFEATFEDGSSCWFSASVTPESCDGKDNDCDGVVDEGVTFNACGGCSTLPADPGESCNVCGQYVCADPESLVCDASCGLIDFGPEPSFVHEGQSAVTTIPDPLTVTLENAPSADTFVAISSSDPALSVVGGGVTVSAGNSSAEVLVNGVSPAAVTLTASLDGASLEADVRVVGVSEQPQVTALTPSMVSVPIYGTAGFEVSLDIPAGAGGSSVSLALAPGTHGSVPPSVLVPEDQLSALFDFTAGGTLGSELLTATLGSTPQATIDVVEGALVMNEVDYDQPGTDTLEFVEIYNGRATPVALSDLSLVLVNGSNDSEYGRVALAPVGVLASGEYLVVGSAALVATVPLSAQTITFAGASNNLQNGAPDGLLLLDESNGTVLDALSYEGEITAANITDVGLVDLVEGTATTEADTGDGSLSRLPNGVDTDDAASDWVLSTTPTPGAENVP